MSIIDDLKRLERAGSETSTTSEKLRKAAKGMAEKILELVKDYPDDKDMGLGYYKKTYEVSYDRSKKPRSFLFNTSCDKDSYEIDALNGPVDKSEYLEYYDSSAFTGGGTTSVCVLTTAAALEFAKDIADGLLYVICENLEEYQAEVAKGLEAMEENLE